MVAAKDVQTQQNGMISVIFATGDSIRRPLDGSTFLQSTKVINALPILVGGMHFCYEDELIGQVYPNPIKLVQLTIDTLTRTKFRVHHGAYFFVSEKGKKVFACNSGFYVYFCPLIPLLSPKNYQHKK